MLHSKIFRFSCQNIHLKRLLYTFSTQAHAKVLYDVAIIGAGSGGLALAIESNKLGLKTALFDFVSPSPQGTKWGIGGTCVNVGCIPKKLLHQSSLLKESIISSLEFGWDLGINNHKEDPNLAELHSKFKWNSAIKNIQGHIKSLNFGYKTNLSKEGIDYFNALAALKNKNTILFSKNKESLEKSLKENIVAEDIQEINAKYIVVAVGARPNTLKSCENAEKYALTSDDIFSLKNPPKKTLVVGGGYIALETAGFLSGLGYPVTLMTRNKYLKEFDGEVSNMIVDHLIHHHNVNVVPFSLPSSIQKDETQYKVIIENQKTKEKKEENFDTVLMAIGRIANTKNIGLEQVGIKINPSNKKIVGGFDGELEKTSVDNIYAVGDVLEGAPELTPVASKSSYLLAKRIFYQINGIKDQALINKTKLSYFDFPTTVFTPLEYSLVGLSEDQAAKLKGKENIEVFQSRFVPLEETLTFRQNEKGQDMKSKVYVKVIVDKKSDKVLGMHYLGPNAGEVMQGYSVAIKMGMTKQNLDETIGIHPTNSEEFIQMRVTKSSGKKFDKTGC